ncbi:ABC transporter permease [Accumulibacter sp.]|uniref:ABC transporter permease n=1 Tax=Accumulibacter sp. TaxID=2053492 RepID=UPI0026086756|nr:ABC transporter permease [Accumulibacter sp.]
MAFAAAENSVRDRDPMTVSPPVVLRDGRSCSNHDRKPGMTLRKVIYTPDGALVTGEGGRLDRLRSVSERFARTSELVWCLFIRDFSGRYRQSILGIAWALILPLATVGVFLLMNRSGLVTLGEVGVPYPVYAMTGLTYWTLFATGVSACASCLINASSMLAKINFTRSALVFSAAAQGGVEFLIRGLLTGAVFVSFGSTPHSLALALLCTLPLFLFTLAVGFILAIVGSLLRDIINALGTLLAGLLILTPILYPVAAGSPLATLNTYNPINYLIGFPRELILYGTASMLAAFLASATFSVLLLLVGWRLFCVAQTRVVERI